MRFTRRRSDRPDTSRRRLASNLEILEGRQMLSGSTLGALYQPTNLYPVHHTSKAVIGDANSSAFNLTPLQITQLSNEGKLVQGQDRQGNQYIIRVQGPGTVIVTDATPQDGVLDDSIDTIQIVGTDPNRSVVNGQVITSATQFTNSEVLFNKLIATSGVRSVVLNGFTLSRTVDPPPGVPNNANTGVFLIGGTNVLSFHNIEAPIDQSTGDGPINIIIGDPSSPITQRPVIRLDSIFNTVFNSGSSTIPAAPQQNPTVNIIVNGQTHGLELVSSTQAPVEAWQKYLFPIVGTTGRTSVRTQSLDVLQASGSLVNTTVSRAAQPFSSGLSGLKKLSRVRLGGNADALGLDVKGNIQSISANQGIGNPTGSSKAATQLGTPVDRYGFPANGLVGGLITGNKIGKLRINPANTTNLTVQNPGQIQIRQGTTNYFPVAGNALTSSAIVTSSSIGSTHIVGNVQNSEIKTGAHYPSRVAGLEPVRAKSHIQPIRQLGNLADSAISSTYRPNSLRVYGANGSLAGPGYQAGVSTASLVSSGGTTILGNTGVGYFARNKKGILPPPETPKRVNGRLIR